MGTSIETRRSGQAIVESLIVLFVSCFVLFSFLQISQAFAEREVMRHAAARAARARAVGFNAWMCEKVMRAAAIPASGRMLAPAPEEAPRDDSLRDAVRRWRRGALWDWSVGANPDASIAEFEEGRIPSYLDSENEERASEILNYEGWDEISASGLGGASSISAGDKLAVKIAKRHPLSIFVRMLNDWAGFVAGGADGLEDLTLRGDFEIENHSSLYLE